MKHLRLAGPGERLSVLCIGAHSDDIEIGAGGTILGLIDPGAGSTAESVDDVAQGSSSFEIELPPFSNVVFARGRL
jgi:hypothetical protein